MHAVNSRARLGPRGRWRRRGLALAGALCLALGAVAIDARLPIRAQPGASGPCRTLTVDARTYSVCEFDLRRTAVRLYLDDAAGKPYGGLGPLVAALTAGGTPPVFAMNAGMYHSDLSPVGLFVADGVQRKAASTADGFGNFHLKPNGVFWVRGTEAGILETSAYLKRAPKADFATQSGPMLVIDGRLHPRFLPASGSDKIRNGVGVRDAHTVVFAISSDPVTFTQFGELFRTTLGCRNALFLDGSISSLYAPSLDRFDRLWPAGPIVAAFPRGKP